MTQKTEPSFIDRLVDHAVQSAPSVALFLGTLIGGWIFARIARRVTSQLADRLGLEVLAEKIGLVRLFYAVGVRQGLARTLGQLAYYLTLAITGYVALMNLGLAGVNNALNQAIDFAPNVAAAAGVVIASALGGQVLKDLIRGDSPTGNRALLGQLVGGATLALGGTLALEQLGFEVELIHGLVMAAFAASAVALALGFALGSRQAFSQLISRHWARKLLREGDCLVMDGTQGTVTHFGAMNVVLHTSDGHEILVPYQLLMGSTFELQESPAEN